jgi:lysophospholipase L1-like esterase
LTVGAYFLGHSTSRSTAPGPSPKIPVTFSAFYLDIGASASLGFQPTGIKGHNGRSTDDGYADDLALMERYLGTSLTVYKTGCPGETLQSYVATQLSKHCNNEYTTQLSKDLTILRAHHAEPGLVTIDIGFNNIHSCLRPATVNEQCVDQAVSAAVMNTPKIVQDLKAAAGPQVRLVGLLYSDPFLGNYLKGSTGPRDAAATLKAMNRMNAALRTAYLAAGAAVANVPRLFHMNDTNPVTLDNVGTVPDNVNEACTLTWMCYSSPFGPDDHPNDAGYAVIARAIFDAIPRRW